MIIILSFLFIQSLANNVPRIKLESKELECALNTNNAWSLDTIFDFPIKEKPIIDSYNIEGSSPCIIQDPYLSLRELFMYADTKEIKDFDITDYHIYYVADNKIYRADLYKILDNEVDEANVVFSFDSSDFTYMSVYNFKNQDIIFLKDNEFKFYYLFDVLNKNPTLKIIPEQFPKFTDQMKLTFYKDLIFVPTGTDGIYIYKYSESTSKIKLEKILTLADDAQDIALKEVNGKIFAVIADYNQGMISFNLDLNTYTESNVKVWKEFIKIKSVVWTASELENKLLLVIDGLGVVTKFSILLLNLESEFKFSYDQIKLMDGLAN